MAQPLTGATSTGVVVSLGMLSLTVSVHSAIGEDNSSALKIVCAQGHEPTPIRQKYVCPTCGDDHASSFVKARIVGDGMVMIPPEVLAANADANAVFKKSVNLTVHPAGEVSGVLLPSGKSYYLSLKSPVQASLDTYTLLARLVQSRPDLAFMAKFTLRSAASVFQLVTAGDGTLVLRQMADADLVREHPAIAFSQLDQRLLDLAGMLADQQTQPFLEASHGSGKSTIIAQYAAMNSPTPLAPAQPEVAAGTVTDMAAALEAMLKTGKKKTPARRRSTATVKAS